MPIGLSPAPIITANDYYQRQFDFYKKEFEGKSSEEIIKMLDERSLYQKIMGFNPYSKHCAIKNAAKKCLEEKTE
ncbi:MAG: hypothetical protein P8X70_00090 [Nanoarchaeota archaeon]